MRVCLSGLEGRLDSGGVFFSRDGRVEKVRGGGGIISRNKFEMGSTDSQCFIQFTFERYGADTWMCREDNISVIIVALVHRFERVVPSVEPRYRTNLRTW